MVIKKSKRLAIYKAALQYIEDIILDKGYYHSGICEAINTGYFEKKINKYYYEHKENPCVYMFKYPELIKFRPKKDYCGIPTGNRNTFWFKCDDNGDLIRIDILKECIKLCSNKKENGK